MPAVCPHCHQLVAAQPECANCGKPLAAPPARPRGDNPAPAEPELSMRDMGGYLVVAVGILGGIVIIFALLIVAIVWLL